MIQWIYNPEGWRPRLSHCIMNYLPNRYFFSHTTQAPSSLHSYITHTPSPHQSHILYSTHLLLALTHLLLALTHQSDTLSLHSHTSQTPSPCTHIPVRHPFLTNTQPLLALTHHSNTLSLHSHTTHVTQYDMDSHRNMLPLQQISWHWRFRRRTWSCLWMITIYSVTSSIKYALEPCYLPWEELGVFLLLRI